MIEKDNLGQDLEIDTENQGQGQETEIDIENQGQDLEIDIDIEKDPDLHQMKEIKAIVPHQAVVQ